MSRHHRQHALWRCHHRSNRRRRRRSMASLRRCRYHRGQMHLRRFRLTPDCRLHQKFRCKLLSFGQSIRRQRPRNNHHCRLHRRRRQLQSHALIAKRCLADQHYKLNAHPNRRRRRRLRRLLHCFGRCRRHSSRRQQVNSSHWIRCLARLHKHTILDPVLRSSRP